MSAKLTQAVTGSTASTARGATATLRAYLRLAALGLLLLPVSQAQAEFAALATEIIPTLQPPPPHPVIFLDPVTDLSVKVWGGEIVIQRGFNEDQWLLNFNWVPLKVTYDSLDNTVKTISRGRTEYGKVAPGVYQDQHNNILRQTDSGGYRWNDPKSNWIEYNLAGEIKAYGNRNGTIATFLYSGPPSTMVTTTTYTPTFNYMGSTTITGTATATTVTQPSSEGHITGILDHFGNQALWFDYDTYDRLIRIRDAAGRKVEYQMVVGSGPDRHYFSYIEGIELTVLDANGNTWKYSAYNTSPIPTPPDTTALPGYGGGEIVNSGTTAGSAVPVYVPQPPPDSACQRADATNINITDPAGRITSRSWYPNGALALTTYADGSTVCVNQTYDEAKQTFYTREFGPGPWVNGTPTGKLTETWSDLKQDLMRGEYQRRDINGITVAKQSYDAANRITTTTDARGLNTAVKKDQWGNITRTTYPDGSSVSSEYDPTYGNVTRHTDENGIVTQNSYDAHGNLLKTIEAVGLPEQRTTDYTVDADGQRTSMTRKGDATTPDAVTQYAYDTSGNVITVTDPEGGITRYTYDTMGNALTKTDPNGKIWQRSYDNRGNLLSITDPLNRTTMIAYDTTGLPISLTDAAGNVSTLGYDATGKLLTVTDPYGAKTSYTYDPAGNPVTVTDAENHTRQKGYDPDGRLVKQIDGNNNATQFVYGDTASGLTGLLVRIVYPTLTQDLQYDQRDRIIQSTDATAGSALALDGSPTQTTKNQYDKAGNLTVVTDPASRSTATKYNAHGEATQTTDPANGTTQYGYDARGNLVSVTDAKGNVHRFEYDRLDRMVKEIRPLGQTITYAYDAVGNLIQVTDPKGQVKKYTVDAANRRTREDHYAAGSTTTPVKSISYSYNTLDRLTGYSDGTTTGTYSYDTKQLRQIGESVNYGTFNLATSTTWNALGQKSSLTYPDGATYGYTYDANNQLSTVNLPTGFGSITINSYLWTEPAQITLPGGTVRNQQYDGLLRLKTFDVKDPTQSQVMSYQYGYDLTSNIVSKATEQGTTNYSYDMLDRLTGASYTNGTQTNESYSYDQVTNRLTDHRTTATWTYNENNQLITAYGISYSYDANGNTTQQTDANNPASTRNYVYDTDNRLIEVRDAGNILIAAYSYDPFGRRIGKNVGTSKTYYFYNAEGLIAEADATGQVTKSYGYAPGSTFTTNPLWMKTGTAYYTYQNDHLGTPMKLLNQSGVTVWSATYDAFGKATVDPSSTVTNNLRFPGQYEDQETGLHYNWNRYYDPIIGRYTTSDPVGLNGGINMYGYVEGDPVNKIDPMGESSCAANCFLSQFGLPELGVGIGIAATGPFVDKPRTGIAGGGEAGDKTSVVSKIAGKYPIKVPGGGRIAGTANVIRGIGRIGGRILPGVGAVMLIYDAYSIGRCMARCDTPYCKT